MNLSMFIAAIPDAARKLHPRTMVRNPVMFVVEVGAVLTTILFALDPSLFAAQITAWLWLTVLFANMAEAVAEGRGKAQAAALRAARKETMARRLLPDGSEELVPGTRLLPGDRVVVEPNEIIPGDGEVVEGVASVDESAITGESAPVIRESGGDRSAVTGGTKVLSDRIVVQITSMPGRDVHRPDDRARRGRQATEDAERDRPQHPAREPDHHLLVGDRHPAAARDLLGRATDDRGSGRAPRCV